MKWKITNVWKKVTLDFDTYTEEKPKICCKIPCSDKMLQNLAKDRERRRQLLVEKSNKILSESKVFIKKL